MSYTLSVAAEEDIFDIALYTAEQWGAKQTRIYTEQLADCMEKLAAKQGGCHILIEPQPIGNELLSIARSTLPLF